MFILYRTPLAMLLISVSSYCYAEETAPPLALDIYPLYNAKNTLDTDTGSSKYVFTTKTIDTLPQGEFTPLNSLLLQAPGVAQDSYGQLHVRGDHANLQYRINGVILPEGISGFGQSLDTHIVQKIDFLTGALPAQYGYRTAGIINITTKTAFENGAKTSLMAGSNATLAANQEAYGASGQVNYFFSGSYLQNNRGIEPPTADRASIHNDTTQDNQFGYLSYALSPEHILSFIVSNSTNRFEIPNNPNQPANYTLNGVPAFDSSALNERQLEHNRFAIAALQGAVNNDSDYQLALFTRYSDVLYKPDTLGDLIFNGVAARDYRESLTSGIQNDYSYRLNTNNTLRAGWTYSYENAKTASISSVFPCCDSNGFQTSTTPFTIDESSITPAQLLGLYLQNEWRATDKLTVNYGARFDYYSAYINDQQFSPRIGLLYDLTETTKLHAGYARYFTPPPTELLTNSSIQKFDNTTQQAANSGNSAVVPERTHYFDAGIEQKVGTYLTLGLDAYYKQVRHLLDEGQFGQALIYAPFNYEKGWVKGIEFTADYKRDALTLYTNLALSRGVGKKVESGQYNFDQDELDYTAGHAVSLDHDQLITGSLGASYGNPPHFNRGYV